MKEPRFTLILNDAGAESIRAQSDSIRQLERAAEEWLNGYAYGCRDCYSRIVDNETGEIISSTQTRTR